jgi:hypothetical protein
MYKESITYRNLYVKETGKDCYSSKATGKDYNEYFITVPCEHNTASLLNIHDVKVKVNDKIYYINQARQQDLFNDEQQDLFADLS